MEDNRVDSLFFCATVTDRRGGHIPFVRARAETSYTGAQAVKPNPRCSRKGPSRRVDDGVEDESKAPSLITLSNHSAIHR